jgi:hypothetical protein
VCQNTAAAKLLCAIEFAPGTYTTQHANAAADFTIKRANRVVAHGTFRIRNGHVSTTRIRRLGHGRYTLTVTVGHGRNARVLVHQAVVIH